MKLHPWFFKFVRRLPMNFSGSFLVTCKEGGIVDITKTDRWTEALFYQRFQEERVNEPTTDTSATFGSTH